MRRLPAAVAALSLVFGGVLLSALPAIADSTGSSTVTTDPYGQPTTDPTSPPADPTQPAESPAPTDPATETPEPTDPTDPPATPDPPATAPSVALTFHSNRVIVDATPGVGSHVVATSLMRLPSKHSTPIDRCPIPGDAGHSSYHSGPFVNAIEGAVTCDYSPLDAGVWRIDTIQDDRDGYSVSALSTDVYFIVPAAPTIASVDGKPDGTITASGAGSPGDVIDVSAQPGGPLCEAVVDSGGTWQCSSALAVDASATITAIERNAVPGDGCGAAYVAGGMSAPSAPATITPAPIDETVVLDPNWTFTLDGIDLSNIKPGDSFSIAGKNLPPGLDVTVELHSTPVTIASTKVIADGSFSARATIPLDTPPGVHRIVVILSGAGITPASKEAVVTVAPIAVASVPHAVTLLALSEVTPAAIAAPTTVETLAEPPAEAAQTGGHEVSEGAIGDAESQLAPNILTEALEPIQRVFQEPGVIASAFAIGLVLIIFATVPAHLLNATLAEQYQRFGGRLSRLRAPRWYTAVVAWFAKETGLGALLLVGATAILFGFADPHFGFNDHSLRLILAITIALFFVAFVSTWITGYILKTRWSVTTMISLRPLGLILTLLGVLASRWLEFSPGFLIGLVLGLSMSSQSIKGFAWRAVAIRSTIIIIFGIAAWVGYSVLTVHGEPHDFLGALLVETFVAITTEGIVMLLVDLLPFKLLEGERLYAHSKLMWGVMYMVVTVVFVVGVVAWEGNWRELGPALWLWIALLGGFGLLCLGVYLYFRYLAPPLPEEEVGEEEPLARVE